MKERVIGTIIEGSQKADVVEVEGMKGFRFDAYGREALPLAVKLADRQTIGLLKLSFGGRRYGRKRILT